MTLNPRCLALVLMAAALAVGCSKKDSRTAGESDAPDRDTDAGEASGASSGSEGMGSKELKEAAASLQKAAPFIGAEAGKALKAAGQAMEQAENVTITPVDFRVLKEMLPEKLAGLPRTDMEGERQMGMSSASGEYSDENGDASISMKIADTGNMRGMLAVGAAYSLSLDIDRESDTGYEKNAMFQGYKAHEKVEGDTSEMTVLVGDRFIIEARGYNVKMDQLKKAVEALPLKKLEGMKDQGVEKKAAAQD